MKTLKTLILISIFQLLTANLVHAYCNFEIVGMGTSPAELQSKVTEVESPDFGLEPSEVKVATASICSDPEYKDLDLVFDNIDTNLYMYRNILGQIEQYDVDVEYLQKLQNEFIDNVKLFKSLMPEEEPEAELFDNIKD